MNLYFRLLRIILRGLFTAKTSIFQSSRLSFRVWPWDIDYNLHLTNSRYLSFMDLGRMYYSGQTRLLHNIIKYKIGLALTGAELSFIKPIPTWKKFDLVTQLVSWDDKYFYFFQRFEVNGELYASGIVKGLSLQKGKKQSPETLMRQLGADIPARPQIPDFIKHWQGLVESKKRETKEHEDNENKN